MKKLALDLMQLRVETFEAGTTAWRGTVRGNEFLQLSLYTNDFSCRGSTCPNPSGAVRCK